MGIEEQQTMTEQPTPPKNSDSHNNTTNDLRDAARLARELFEASQQQEEEQSLETLSGEEPVGSETSVLPSPPSESDHEHMGNTTNDLLQAAYKALELEQQVRASDEQIQQTQTRFDPATMHLVIYVTEMHEELAKIVDHDLVVGRADSVTDYMPDIDLTPFGAYRLGLSRRHAIIRVENQALIVKDLQSRNGTFVNGTRVPSGGTLPLHDGDAVRFGNLSMKISFRSASE